MKRHYISSETTLSKENIEGKTLYYKNDDELKNDTNSSQENFSETDFKNEIKSNVSKFINKKFDNIVFLAGAGASVVTDAKGNIDSNFGKTVKIIADDIFKKLNEEQNLYSIQELAELTYFNRNENIIQIKDGKETLIDNFNLEDFLSNLLHFEPFVIDEKDKYITTKNRILTLIKNNTDYSYQSSILKHGAILKILTKRIEAPNKLSVVTTNYDTLFEGAAAAGNYTIFDGFNFLAEPQFDSDMFDWNLVREISNIKTKELEYSKRVFNLIKIHGSLTWERNSNGKIMRRRKQDISDIENTVMIFPSSDKYAQSYQEPYFELFLNFKNF